MCENVEIIKEIPPLNITIVCGNYLPTPSDEVWGDFCANADVKIGRSIRLTCLVNDITAPGVDWVTWISPNGSDFRHLNVSDVSFDAVNASATLKITDFQMEDVGNYTCLTSHRDLRAMVEVQRFVPPDYFLAGVIILSINAGLLILFVVCLIRSLIREKKAWKSVPQKEKT